MSILSLSYFHLFAVVLLLILIRIFILNKRSCNAKSDNFHDIAKEITDSIILFIFIMCLILIFIAKISFVHSDSMYPTLKKNDFIVINKLIYRFKKHQRGDVVSFNISLSGSQKEVNYTKRIVAIADDVIEMKNGKLFINEKPVKEKYLKAFGSYNISKTRIPSDNIFVLGDNRPLSNDSRILGSIPVKNVTGKVFFRIWPPASIGTI